MPFTLSSLLQASPSVWERLQNASLPIVFYGTGDGADKIISVMQAASIPLHAIFVSDDFYRGQHFHGFPVTTLAQLEAALSDFIIVVAFGSHLPEIIDRVTAMAQKHPLVIPDVPVYGHALFDRSFAHSHAAELEAAYALLADDASRQVFEQVLTYKLTGALTPLLQSASPKQEVFSELLPLHDHENYLDLGAYRGDTIQEFLTATGGKYDAITALEPDARSFKKLTQFSQPLAAVRPVCCGVSDRNEVIYMKTGRGRGSSASAASSGTPVQMTTIDSLSLPVSYLKMDVEGFEAAALRGGADTLKRLKPKLNIACYHRSEDLYLLPLLIHELQPAYQIFMRRHPCLPCWDLNLYCR